MSRLNAFFLNQIFAVPVLMLGGVVLQDLWEWFIVPMGGTPLGFWQALGIITLVAMFKFGLARQPMKDMEEKPLEEGLIRLTATALGYLMAWGYGAIWHAFMPA